MDFFNNIPPIWCVIIASCFTWGVTALGASVVFFFTKVNQKVLDIMMGFSAGVMIAASFWSLLAPALELSAALGYIEWLLPTIGFLAGGLMIVGANNLLDRCNFIKSKNNTGLKRSVLLVSAVTLHNIPEGMAVGVAFGGIVACIPGCEMVGALILALGIGLQNFPEGASVALPLRREGVSRAKSFFYGQASGFVEPIAAIIGFFLAVLCRSILPFMLAFSAGAMIGVAGSELLPESTKENKNLAVIGCIVGFIVMMIMDVALG